MRTNVRFRSRTFRADGAGGSREGPPERGRGGDRLAAWVLERLRAASVTATGPVLEDWGCLLSVAGEGGRCVVGCGPVDGPGDEWLVFVEPVATGWRRLLGRPAHPDDATGRICRLLHDALAAEPEVDALEWFRVDRRSGRESDHAPTPL